MHQTSQLKVTPQGSLRASLPKIYTQINACLIFQNFVNRRLRWLDSLYMTSGQTVCVRCGKIEGREGESGKSEPRLLAPSLCAPSFSL